MIKPFLYLVFLVSFTSTAQNLVPNGSFEEYSQCPDSREASDGQFERCTGWWYPTNYSVGSPDYFNVCNNSGNGIVGVPNNEFGYQHAFDGNAYVGLGAFEYSLNSNEVFAVELISAKLFDKLKPCHSYHFSMRINLADRATHGISKLGVLIAQDSLYINTLADWESIEPTWANSSSLFDTSEWISLEFDYLANGGERYVTIGYFGEYDETELIFNDSLGINIYNSYFPFYYIDSVSLFEVEEVENCLPNLPNVFTPNNDFSNDSYSIEGLDVAELIVFNRWGNVITTLTKDNPIWDGTFEGKLCSEGSYFYRAQFGTLFLTGFIELIR